MEAFIEITCDCGLLSILPAQGELTCENCGGHFEVELRFTPARGVA